MTDRGRSSQTGRVDALVIGAGFAGLYALHRLRDLLGLDTVVLEAGGGVGGTWYWNRYPGARSDSESFAYCYSFDEALWKEWEWSHKYTEQAELLRYFEHVVDRFDLRRSIVLHTRVTTATYHEARREWLVETDTGDRIRARYLVSGIGFLTSAPYTPHVAGLESFAGEVLHTSSWPHDPVDLRGRRVAIMGTGSTGVQAIPAIAREAEHLYVLQRTANYSVPARQREFDADDQRELKARYAEIRETCRWSSTGFPYENNGRSAVEATPAEREKIFEQLWQTGGMRFPFGSFRDLLTDRRANDFAAEFIRRKIRETVADPAVAELLAPVDHPFSAKRPIIDSDYFETYNRDNVTLVDLRHSPLVEATPHGIVTTHTVHDVDTLVFATGFDAITGPYLRMDIRGIAGRPLRDKWAAGPSSYLGMMTAGFPNLFMVTGPAGTFGNLPITIEMHVEWITDCIAHLEGHGLRTADVEPDAEGAWMDHARHRASRSLAFLADSWFTGANIPGKPRSVMFYLGSFGEYHRMCADVASDGFRGLRLA